ncbi:outer membrane lipoprotein carrier protein LolA [Arenimonas sp.]|uniref:outer membrane lipoprotein carrier protein LolA n=1 Tax=Arenimonas sp. TaxID=1872635 RepID=UPI0035B199F5
MRPWFAMLLLAASLAQASLAVAADEALAGVRSRIEQPDVLRGRFEQEKHLKGFRNPLRSAGTMLLVRESGIAWDTAEPFASSAVLTREKLTSELPDGSRQVLLDAADGPAASATAGLLMALVAGDLDALAERFEIAETLLDDGAWRLELRPREPALKRVFAGFELGGDRHVREVLIEETGGDTTRVRLLDLSSEPATPSPAEVARFD